MIRQNAGGSRLFAFLFPAIFLLQITAGCGAASPHTVFTRTQATTTPQEQVSGPLLPTPIPPSHSLALHGPTNFLLRVPFRFSDVSGTTTDGNGTVTQLDASTIETGINGEFKHLLFVVDSNDTVKVYTSGSATPITAQVTQHADGSTTIDYTQTTNSEAGSFSLTFEGVLVKNQLVALYEQQYSPLVISSVSASDVKVAFTASVRWISADEIPASPENGSYHFTGNSQITLSWSGSQQAVAYDVYRLIPDRDQQFQLLGTVKTPSYDDSSPEALQNAHSASGVVYAIFSVGATGVENPMSLTIPISMQ